MDAADLERFLEELAPTELERAAHKIRENVRAAGVLREAMRSPAARKALGDLTQAVIPAEGLRPAPAAVPDPLPVAVEAPARRGPVEVPEQPLAPEPALV